MIQTEDWYEQAIRSSVRAPMRSAPRYRRSTAWHYSGAMETSSERAFRLLGTLRSFARNQGVPANTIIRLAAQTEVGTACAGFLDAPRSCTKPFILLDKPLLDRMADADHVDAMVGLVLHEAAHILYTREFYRLTKRERSEKIAYFENLLEDYRIEALLALTSPGYVPYIEATKQVLLVDQWFRRAVNDWEHLADTRRIMALIGSFVRAPQVFEDHPQLKEWTDLMDRNIFQELRRRLPQAPRTEADVRRLAVELNDLVDNYFDRSLAYLASTNDGEVTEEQRDRLIRQRDADHEEALYERLKPKLRELQADALGTIGALLDASEQRGHIDEGFDEQTLRDIEQIDSETSAVTHAPAQAPNEAPINRLLPSQIREFVKLVAVEPAPHGTVNYVRAKSRVANQIARLQSAFPRNMDVTVQHCSSVTGRLDARRLWRAAFDERIFSNSIATIAQTPVKLVLLLDASKSMELMSRYARALDTAVLFREALQHHPFVSMQLYSHSSAEVDGKQKCILSVYSGTPADIGTYRLIEANYDDVAIQAVTAIENKKMDRQSKRILIVISDGLPCDIHNTQQVTTCSTKQAVETCRKQGWKILGVGIGTSHVVGIYGERWSLCVPDGNYLPDRMAMMLVRLLRQCHC